MDSIIAWIMALIMTISSFEMKTYTQEDITLLMNHINSTRRKSLGNKAPYEMVSEEDEDMRALFGLLKMDLIPPDEVHLKPNLFSLNK
mgnify:CR=1 FL=1